MQVMQAEAARQAAAQGAAAATKRVRALEGDLGAAQQAAEAHKGTARKLSAELAEARSANQVCSKSSFFVTPCNLLHTHGSCRENPVWVRGAGGNVQALAKEAASSREEAEQLRAALGQAQRAQRAAAEAAEKSSGRAEEARAALAAAEAKLRTAGRDTGEREASAEALQAELRAALAARDHALKVMTQHV